MIPNIKINGRKIASDEPPYIIAELSANHNGELERARAIVRAAKEAGVDAVKLQTYTPDTMTIDSEREEFTIRGGLWDGAKLYDLYQEAHTPWDWHPILFEDARALGLTIFSSPFDATAVEFLENLGAPAYKIASFEIIDIPLIERCARTGKPLIISRGMATLQEIEEAVAAARGAGCEDILLLHCTSGYPTSVDDCNLATIPHMSKKFDLPVGLSDHTIGPSIPIAACALGACAIEKHVTLEDGDGGPDGAFSLGADELRIMVEGCRDAHRAIGNPNYIPTAGEEENRSLRRSIYAVVDIQAGETLTTDNIRCIRPGNGLPPKEFPKLLGVTAVREIARGEPIAWHQIDQAKGS